MRVRCVRAREAQHALQLLALLFAAKVFPTSAYAHLFEALQNTTATGGPTFHLATYNVLSNQYQAIFGGWQVRPAAA